MEGRRIDVKDSSKTSIATSPFEKGIHRISAKVVEGISSSRYVSHAAASFSGQGHASALPSFPVRSLLLLYPSVSLSLSFWSSSFRARGTLRGTFSPYAYRLRSQKTGLTDLLSQPLSYLQGIGLDNNISYIFGCK